MSSQLPLPAGWVAVMPGIVFRGPGTIQINEGVLMVSTPDAIEISAPGSWELLRIERDPDYVAPAPEPAAEVPAPDFEDPTIEPPDGWLDEETSEKLMEILDKGLAEDSFVKKIYGQIEAAGIEIAQVSVADDATEDQADDAYWAAISRVSRRIRPYDGQPTEGPVDLEDALPRAD